jgi:hypothetical protein
MPGTVIGKNRLRLAQPGLKFVAIALNRFMARHKTTKSTDPLRDAQREAEKDIHSDPDFEEGGPTDDLDEGELAQRDNSDEEGFDALEKKRPRGGQAGGGSGGSGHHPGKGSEK